MKKSYCTLTVLIPLPRYHSLPSTPCLHSLSRSNDVFSSSPMYLKIPLQVVFSAMPLAKARILHININTQSSEIVLKSL